MRSKYRAGFHRLQTLRLLLLCFLMLCVRLAPFAVLRKVHLAGDELPVLARPIIRAAALRTREFEKLILRHIAANYSRERSIRQSEPQA